MTRQRGKVWVAALLCAIVGAAWHKASAQTPAPAKESGAVLRDTFDTDVAEWHAFGPNGKASVTTEADHVKIGRGALEFSYFVGDKSGKQTAANKEGANPPFDALYRPTPNGALAKMRSLHFWIRTDDDLELAMGLQEKGAGRYMTMIWVPKGVWQQVSLAPEDFWLADDKNDPKDPDGKLDLDQVESINMMSVWSFMALGVGDSPDSVAMLSGHTGPHMLWLDDFTVSAEPLVRVPALADPNEGKGVWIDDFSRDMLAWLPLGDLKLSLDTNAPWKGRALRADYTQQQGRYIALIHDMHPFNLTHADRLTLEVASAKSAKLYITLEEKNGARYNASLDVPGDSVPTRKSISFGEFTLAEDSPKDPDGQLDLDQLRNMTIVDVTGFLGLGKQKNTLWIGPIRAQNHNL